MPDTSNAQLYAEIREQILREQAMEAEQCKINANTFTKVLHEFNDDFKKFDWVDSRVVTRPWNGTTYVSTDNYVEAYKVKAAIGALVKAAFRAKSAGKIPASKEALLRKVTQEILNIVLSEAIESRKAA